MPSLVVTATELVTGERMTVDEFLHRWEELPDLKNAELINLVVHVSSLVSYEHGSLAALISWWLAHYAHATPGCGAGNNSTWLMLDSAPQPDAYLRILPAHGGQAYDGKLYPDGVYLQQVAPADGILRSEVFPGLWLDAGAFWADDGAKLLAALNAGLASEDQQKFAARLAAAK
jgi:Uma2 family endonuclease